jgi:hypothetical protein
MTLVNAVLYLIQGKEGSMLVIKGFALGAGLFLLATIAFFTLHLRVKNPRPGAASYAMVTGDWLRLVTFQNPLFWLALCVFLAMGYTLVRAWSHVSPPA